MTKLPRNKYPEETKLKILEAATKTFSEKGYEESTILDIVANMEGLTRGAFYHHFKSKEDVLNELLDKIFYDTNPFDVVSKRNDLNGLQKIKLAMKLNFASIDDEYMDLRIAGIALLQSPKFFMENLNFNVTVAREWLYPLIEEGVADGSIVVKNPLLVAELTVVLFNYWLLPVIFSGNEEYIAKKAVMASEILDSVGLNIIDDAVGESGLSYIGKMFEETIEK